MTPSLLLLDERDSAAALSLCARRSSLDQRSWSSSKPALGQVAVETLVEIA
jgi:hypothetical protein